MQLLSKQVKFSSCAAGLILFFFSAASLFAEDRATTGSAKSLAAAETAFAQESVEKGMRSAFLQVLSDDSIVFLPGPQNGKKASESQPASEAVLQWPPVLAATSTSGDLGYTTGPWSSQNSAADKEPTDFGHFVSIWRWEDGKWKLLFDLGSDHPRPAGPARSCSWWKITPLTNRPSPLCRPCWPSIAVTPRTASGIFPRSQRI